MSASPSPIPRTRPGVAQAIPTAGPPPSKPTDPLVSMELPTEPEPWWTPESLRGWVASCGLHVSLLIILAFCYFSPETRRAPTFDSRLAGSPDGLENAESLTGGINTPLPMPPSPMVADETPLLSPALEKLEMPPIEPRSIVRRNSAPGGGGGPDDRNPGAGDGDGFGIARFGNGGELIRGVQVKVGDPQFTLLWDTNDVDLDLHVIEPGGKEIYWEDPKGNNGGELDVDNTKGFGPENIYWMVESDGPGSEKVKGAGPSGVYKWFVVYWGGFGGISKPTHWQVRVKHAGQVHVYHGKFKALNERSKTHTFTVEPAKTGAT